MKYKFSDWLIENKDWDWKPQEWEPKPPEWETSTETPPAAKANIGKSPTVYFDKNRKSPGEWKIVFFRNMKELNKNLSKEQIDTVMYRFNQIIKQLSVLENQDVKELTKDDVLRIAKSVEIGYDTTNILKRLFDKIEKL